MNAVPTSSVWYPVILNREFLPEAAIFLQPQSLKGMFCPPQKMRIEHLFIQNHMALETFNAQQQC